MLNCTPLPSGLVVYDIPEVSNDVRSATKVLFNFAVELEIIFQKQKTFCQVDIQHPVFKFRPASETPILPADSIFVISKKN